MATTSTPIAPITLPDASLELPPRTVTKADPDGSQVPSYLVPTGGVQMIQVGANATAVNGFLQLQVYFLGTPAVPGTAGPVIATAVVNFSTTGAADWGPLFVGQPSQPTWLPLAGAKALAIRVLAMSGGGTWTIFGALQ